MAIMAVCTGNTRIGTPASSWTLALKQHPAWKINLQIEPEKRERAKANDPVAYAELQALAADQRAGGRIEFVNLAYAQPYLWNISGESIIRQFQYGIKKDHRLALGTAAVRTTSALRLVFSASSESLRWICYLGSFLAGSFGERRGRPTCYAPPAVRIHTSA